MTKDYEQMGRDFIAAAREYRSWDEARLEQELRRQASEQGCDLELLEPQPGVWRAAFTKPDTVLHTGVTITLVAAETGVSRHRAMEDLALMLRFEQEL